MPHPPKANASLAGEANAESADMGGLQIESSTGENALCEVAYSRGANKFDNTPAQLTAPDFVAFRDAILADRADAKGRQYIAAPCAPDLALDGKPHRNKACALPRRFVGLDVDGSTPEAFAAAVLHLHRYSGLVYTTASHTHAAPRFRVVLELDMPAPRAELMAASRAIRARIDAALAEDGHAALPWDASCDRPEQPLYLPLTGAQAYVMDGAPLALGDLLADMPAKPAQKAPQAPPTDTSGTPTAWALGALASACRAVEQAAEGERNEVLNRESHSMGGFVPTGQLSQSLAEAALFDATRRAGYATPDRDLKKIRDGIASGMLEPRTDGMPLADVAASGLLNKMQGAEASNDAWGFLWGDEMTSPSHLKPSEWAIYKVLPSECTGLLYGGWGTCKTFVAIDMAGCIANGIDWHGKPTQRGTVFYLAGEGEGGFARRLAAWQIANGASMAGLAFREMPRVRKPEELARLVHTIGALAEKRGAPRLIVLDTLFTALAGGQENDGKDMGEVFEAMKLLRQQFRCAVLAVHHTGHDGDRARGHSSMPAGVDVQFYLKARDAKDGSHALELTNPKQKDGKEHPLIFLAADPVEIAGLVDDKGETESSLVIRAPAADMVAHMREQADDKPGKAELVPVALELRGRGHTLDQIAEQVGRDKATVSRWLKEAA
ncbi:MAG: AAA family ATPase [Acidobacteriota bacterium]|nr:AAA family ATPase [Xanthomonadaceae bacterium]MDE3188907.1 AAA family ATPase [Acidobacteriota bacterium]